MWLRAWTRGPEVLTEVSEPEGSEHATPASATASPRSVGGVRLEEPAGNPKGWGLGNPMAENRGSGRKNVFTPISRIRTLVAHSSCPFAVPNPCSGPFEERPDAYIRRNPHLRRRPEVRA